MDTESLQRLRSAAAEVFANGPVLVAYAYGSRVSGRTRADSDLDVGYYVTPGSGPLPVKDEMIMAAELSDRLGVDVDLRALDDAPLELRGRILEEGIRIYSGNDVDRVSLERATISFYHDYKDVFRRMHEVRLQARASRGVS
jgi:predicted nucleotidyltransferase